VAGDRIVGFSIVGGRFVIRSIAGRATILSQNKSSGSRRRADTKDDRPLGRPARPPAFDAMHNSPGREVRSGRRRIMKFLAALLVIGAAIFALFAYGPSLLSLSAVF
jgi:hypothetical protein